MKLVKIKSLLGITAPLIFVAACGGTSSSSDEEPDVGQGNVIEVPTTAVVGRVADGYLQGAVVCVDINENGNCDSDEPQSVSGPGGSYSLDVPDDAADKPILAIVPATAIDEDTGEEIGKALQFSTPGDKPWFVSPITTLVHQELKKNPSLNTEDAEATVLETLGMPDEKDASLFTDYVANSESGDEELREKFHYLHQTARVVATMMGEIQENVENVAVENGIDASGDAATQAAIRQLVEDEVRALLPEISAAVAEQISELRAEAQATDSTESTAQNFEIDPDAIAGDLEVEEVSTDIVAEIEAIKAENPVRQASMKEIMTQGFYLLDVDCHEADEYGPEDGIENDREETGAVVLHDDGTPGRIDLPEHCEANYSYITVTGADSTLQEERYFYDADNATWIKDASEDNTDEKPHMLVLVDGKWVAAFEGGPSGPAEFTADGGAILGSEQGKMKVYATERVLDGTPVLHHLKGRGAEGDIANLVSSDLLFNENSSVYKLHIKQDSKLTVLFNWYAEQNEDDTDDCAEFNGNCNVVGESTENGFVPFVSLASIQESSLHGVMINEIVYDYEVDSGIDIKLEADVSSTGAFPDSGTVSWRISNRSSNNNQQEPYEVNCEELDPGYIKDPADVDTETSTESRQDGEDDSENAEPVCAYPMQEPYTDGAKEGDIKFEENNANVDNAEKVIASSHWKTTVHEGVSMIEIDVPVAIHHRMDQDEVASMLLIEQDDLVRRGARFSEQSVDDEVAYSQATFTTLQPIIEKYVSD